MTLIAHQFGILGIQENRIMLDKLFKAINAIITPSISVHMLFCF